MADNGKFWYEHLEHYVSKLRTRFSIPFAFVATHNHFVFDRGGKVFNRSAPIIKLRSDSTEADHLALVALLNTSVACFWMQQTFHNKGGPGGGSSKDEKWHDFYEFSATALQRFPVSQGKPLELGRKLDALAQQYAAVSTEAIMQGGIPASKALDEAKQQAAAVRRQMVATQEELDWHSYELYGLLSDDLSYDCEDLPLLSPGERAFEIVMARQLMDGILSTRWFEWLHVTPITEIPTHWPTAYQELVARRIQIIESSKEIALIEKPDCKRRWETESWDAQQQRALQDWLLDRLESHSYWPTPEQEVPRLQSVAELSDKASSDHDFLQVAAIYRERDDFNLPLLVAELVASESVPCLPILRYKTAGLRKREVWEKTWELQREEDAGQEVGKIKVPPKYATADFQKSDYWRLRGKLDVPKERWISCPHCETASDPSLVVGWAGWNHLQQGTAIVAYYDARKNEGWSADQLKPLLAGLDQLLPWIHQWHPEIDPEYNETAGTSFQTLLESEAQELGLTMEQIRNWTPPAKKKATKKKAEGGSKPRKARSTRKKAETEVEEDNDE